MGRYQGPGPAGSLVARHAELEPAKVMVRKPTSGAPLGARALTHVVEATQISKATGTPIKLLWTREDDLRGLYRPASLMRIRARARRRRPPSSLGCSAGGVEHHPGNDPQFSLPAMMPGMPDGVVDFMVGMTDRLHQGWVVNHSSIEGLYEDYAVPNLAVHHATKEHGIPVTFWRSVGHSYTAFAKEVTMDALAEGRRARPWPSA